MSAVRSLVARELRRRGPGLVAIGLLAGLVGLAVVAALAGLRRTTTAYDRLGENLGLSLPDMVKGQMAAVLKQAIESYVTTGTVDNSSVPQAEQIRRQQERVWRSLKSIKYVKQDSPNAIVGVEVKDEGMVEPKIIELKMRPQEGGYWQIFEISNLRGLVRQ